jgi:hypothetical protein
MRFSSITLLALVLAACGENSLILIPGEDGDIQVTVPATQITIAIAAAQGVTATVRNNGNGVLYSQVGDATGGEEQNNLFTASGSHAALERQTGDTWTEMPRPVAIEGTRVVRILPGKNYTLAASFVSPVVAGTYRMRLDYSDVDGGTGAAPKFTAVSPTFEVR